MPDHTSSVAIVVCPLCRKRHTVRVNDGRVGVECGSLVEVLDGPLNPDARVWPPGKEHLTGRLATIISVTRC